MTGPSQPPPTRDPSASSADLTPQTPYTPPITARPRARGGIRIIIGWTLLILISLSAFQPWVRGSWRRHSSIDAMMAGDPAGGIGFLIGHNLFTFVALILGASAFTASGRRKGRLLMPAAVLLMVVDIAGQLRPSHGPFLHVGSPQSDQQARQAAKDLSRLMDQAIAHPGEAPAVDPTPVASEAAHGEWSPMVKATQDYMQGMLADATQYQSGVLALQLDAALLPMRLDSAQEINDSKAKLASARGLFAKYELAIGSRIATARNAIASAPYPPDTRQYLVGKFNTGLATSKPLMDKVLFYEKEMYGELGELLDFMLAQQGKFQVQGNKLLFAAGADAATYNASLNRFRAIASRQVEVREAMQEAARAGADRMRKAANADKPEDLAADTPDPTPHGPHEPVLHLELTDAGPTLDGKPLHFPMPLADLVAIIGEPTKTVEKAVVIHIWDTLGILASTEPGSQEVDIIEFVLNRQHVYEYSPAAVFSGELTLAATVVNDIDTPRSLNRRLQGITFQPVDPAASNWSIDFPAYRIEMTLEEDGLSDSLDLLAPPKPEPPKKEEFKIRF